MSEALVLLKWARELNNQTVRDAREVDEWHRRVDALMKENPMLDDEKERFGYPPRVEQRRFVEEMFFGRSRFDMVGAKTGRFYSKKQGDEP